MDDDGAVLNGAHGKRRRPLPLSALGGLGGALLGIAVTAGYAAYQHWPAVVPLWATTGGVLATLVIGACVGIYPAWRAARMPPTDALTTP